MKHVCKPIVSEPIKVPPVKGHRVSNLVAGPSSTAISLLPARAPTKAPTEGSCRDLSGIDVIPCLPGFESAPGRRLFESEERDGPLIQRAVSLCFNPLASRAPWL